MDVKQRKNFKNGRKIHIDKELSVRNRKRRLKKAFLLIWNKNLSALRKCQSKEQFRKFMFLKVILYDSPFIHFIIYEWRLCYSRRIIHINWKWVKKYVEALERKIKTIREKVFLRCIFKISQFALIIISI